MNRRETILALLALGAAPILAPAQPVEKVYRVAWALPTGSPPKIFLRELNTLGYVEGRNLIIDHASADGHFERFPDVVAELLRRKPDVLVVTGSQMALVAKKATSSVAIVMNAVAQPVNYGLVASLAQPGGNVTGTSAEANPETEAKRLELLKELVPKLSRVTCLVTKWVWDGPFGDAIRLGASKIAITLLYAEHKPDDLKATFATITRQRPDALLVALTPEVYFQRQQIADFSLKARLPGIYPFAEFVEAGGLISYGWRNSDVPRRTANYVDKILKGAKPADLPVEQPTEFDLVINLKTAKALGLKVPASLLVRADRVIE